LHHWVKRIITGKKNLRLEEMMMMMIKSKLGWAWLVTRVWHEICVRNFSRKFPKNQYRLSDLTVDGRIMLKRILKIYDVWVWIGLIGLKMGRPVASCCEHCNEFQGLQREISWRAERLSDSLVGYRAVEIIIIIIIIPLSRHRETRCLLPRSVWSGFCG
jgi:hypothetical protein